MLALIVGTHLFWPSGAALARYDFLVLAALAIQVALLALKLERWDEAAVIAVFHVVGTVMEVFKTAHGSWIYPEPGLLKIAGVPLFSGFMYACIGSYIARIWRLMDFRFTGYPPIWTTWTLAILAYLNFFTHHYGPDIRIGLFAASAALFGRTWVVFTPDRTPRRMPLLLGFGLVALFIWLAENLGTLAGAWAYPSQRHGWLPAKLGAWMAVYVLVTAVQGGGADGIVPADAAQAPAQHLRHPCLVGRKEEGGHAMRTVRTTLLSSSGETMTPGSSGSRGRSDQGRSQTSPRFAGEIDRTFGAGFGHGAGLCSHPPGCFFGAATMMMRSSSLRGVAARRQCWRGRAWGITPPNCRSCAPRIASRRSLERSYNILWLARSASRPPAGPAAPTSR
jgi:uncharacterized membrane protein YoaT (DUF817 family)